MAPDLTVSRPPLSVTVSPVKFAPSKMNSSPLATLPIFRLVLSPVVKPPRNSITPLLRAVALVLLNLAVTAELSIVLPLVVALPNSRWPPEPSAPPLFGGDDQRLGD